MGTLASKNPQAKPAKPKEEKKKPEPPKVNVKDVVVFGNEHKGIKDKGNGTHNWTMYLRGHDGRRGNSRDDFGIEKVEFKLHPDYNPSTISCLKPPFEVTRDGWGVFDVTATVTLKKDSENHFELRRS